MKKMVPNVYSKPPEPRSIKPVSDKFVTRGLIAITLSQPMPIYKNVESSSNLSTQKILKIMRKDPSIRAARIIGRVTKDNAGKVYMNTVSGGKRIVSMLSGEQLPRIC